MSKREHLNEKINVYTQRDEIKAYYQSSNGNIPLRIIRTNSWERAIIRMIHAYIRLSPAKAFGFFDLMEKEFGELYSKNPDRAKEFIIYMDKLESKEFGKLGVNV